MAVPLSWRERLAQQPHWGAIGEWPALAMDALPASKRRAYLRNRQIVAAVLAGEPMGAVGARHRVSASLVSQLMARCLSGEPDQPPALNRGLLPNANLHERQRRAQLPSLARPGGTQTAFRALLDALPGVKQALDQAIEASLADRPYAQRLAPAALFGEFHRALAAAQWPNDRYPYTSQSQGYHSVRRYLYARRDELLSAQAQRRAAPALIVARTRYDRALRVIQIDEHKLDVETRVHLALNDELIALRLRAAVVLAATDEAENCVLGYHFAPTRAANQWDLLALLANCLTPWTPLELQTPGLAYEAGAGFPSAMAHAFPISFGVVKLDNALMHLAHSVRDFLCTQMGATLSFGPPATPRVRYLVESTFKFIEDKLGHRAASTTGSYPTDPNKESRRNREKPPLITAQTVNEALSVLLSGANVTPLAGLGTAAPLALYEHHFRNHYLSYVHPEIAAQWHPLLGTETVRLHWYRHENRLPHINFLYERYHGPGLLDVAGRERYIVVHFDRRDIRTLHAYTLHGRDLGPLQVCHSWQRFPHSIATRRWIHSHQKTLRFDRDDPLAGLFRYLLEHRDTPSTALSLLRVYTEFSGNFSMPVRLDGPPDAPATAPSPASPPREPSSPYVWTPGMAKHR